MITIALLSSWVLALTMTPLLCVLFLKVRPVAAGERFAGPFYGAYRGLLTACLRRPGLTLAAVGGVFLLATFGLRFVPRIFFPPADKAIFTAAYELPAGTSIERTIEVVEAVDGFIASELRAGADAGEGVTKWATFVGNGGPRFYLGHSPQPANPQFAFSLLNATDRDVITDELIPRIAAFCRDRFPELEVTLGPLQTGPPVSAPVQVRLSGRNPDPLFDIVDAVEAELRAVPGATTVTDDWGMRSKKLVVAVDQPRARRAGVTSQDIAISLQTALSGFETTQYREGETIIPVTLRSSQASRADVTKLDSVNVYAQATGVAVPLLQVADASVAWEPSTIRRRDGLQTVTVSSEFEPGVTAVEVVTAGGLTSERDREWYRHGTRDSERAGANHGRLCAFGVGTLFAAICDNPSIGGTGSKVKRRVYLTRRPSTLIRTAADVTEELLPLMRTAAELKPGRARSVRVGPGEFSRFAVRDVPDGMYRIDAAAASEGFDPSCTCTDTPATDSSRSRDDDGGEKQLDSRIIAHLNGTEDYVVGVTDFGGDSGSVTLSIALRTSTETR